MITTHVLDTSRGKPATGVMVTLDRQGADGNWSRVGHGETDQNGRLNALAASPLESGMYRPAFRSKSVV